MKVKWLLRWMMLRSPENHPTRGLFEIPAILSVVLSSCFLILSSGYLAFAGGEGNAGISSSGVPVAGVVSGKVVDSISGEGIADASVVVKGTILGATTDPNGGFIITGVQKGACILEVTHVAYNTWNSGYITVRGGGITMIRAVLTPRASVVEGVVVVAERESSVEGSIVVRSPRRTVPGGDAGDMMESVPSVSVIRPEGRSGPALASIRGSSPGQVLVLVDGVKLNDPATGYADLSTVPLSSIEKIEIVDRPYSASRGSGAMAGAILITTKSGIMFSGIGTGVSLGIGSFGNKWTSSWFRNGFLYTAFDSGSGGRTMVPGELWKNDAFGSFTGSVAFSSMEGIVPWKLDASIFERNRGISGTDELPFDHAVSSERMITAGFHAGVPLGSGPRVKITAGVKRTDTLYNNEEYIPARDRSIVDSRNFEAEMEGKPDNALKLDIGAVWMLEELSGENLLCPESEIGMHSRESRSIFSGFEWKQSENTGLGITGAARADAVDASFYSGFSIDSFESFRPYNGIDIRLVAGWGSAYRLPTFNELFWIQDVFAEGNPDLEPEESEAINASITVSETAEREIRCRLSAHSTKYKNLIYWMPTPPAGRWKPHNLASAAIDGIEFRASVDPSVGLGGELSFLIQRTRDLEGSAWEEPNTYGRELIYRPNFSGSGGLEWNGDISEQGLLSVRLNGRYTGTRYATRANTVSLPGYFLMDCSISYGFTLKNGALSAETGLSISNLANRRFEIYQDTTGPGRKWKFYMSLEKKEE